MADRPRQFWRAWSAQPFSCAKQAGRPALISFSDGLLHFYVPTSSPHCLPCCDHPLPYIESANCLLDCYSLIQIQSCFEGASIQRPPPIGRQRPRRRRRWLPAHRFLSLETTASRPPIHRSMNKFQQLAPTFLGDPRYHHHRITIILQSRRH